MKQAERVDRSTNALLDAAIAIVIVEGYAGLSFAELGKRSGYSRSLVTERFGSKEGLVSALFDRITTNWDEFDVAGDTSAEALDRLTSGWMHLADRWEVEPARIRCLWQLMQDFASGDEVLRMRCSQLHEASRGRLLRALRRGREEGSIREDIDPVREADHQLGALRGIGFEVGLNPDYDVAGSLRHLAVVTRERLSPE